MYTRAALAAAPARTGGGEGARAGAGLAGSAECVSITIKHNGDPVHIIAIYRPPKSNKISQFLNEFELLLQSIPPNSKVVICGDINLNILNPHDTHIITYENIFAGYGFVKCINDVTRKEIINRRITESCLDHVYVRGQTEIIHSAVIKHKISDHYCTAAAIQWERTALAPCGPAAAIPPAAKRLILDNRLVREKLLETDFKQLLNIECPLELYRSFCGIFDKIYVQCYKTVSVSSVNRNNKTWISDNLKSMIKERDRLFTIWSADPKSMIKRLAYTSYRNKCNKAITKKRNEYDKNCILECNKNIKKMWDRINAMMGNDKKSLDTLILNSMEGQGNVSDICNKFADNFSREISLVKHVCNNKWLNRNDYVSKAEVCMRWQPVEARKVMRIIKNMSSKKSPGCDRIRMSDLKIISDKVSPVIAKLINLSVLKGKFPEDSNKL